jgi:hypothetical protein
MNSFNPNGGGSAMVEKIPDLPENVLGFTASGTVTANDYETVIIPAVEAMFVRQGKVRFLYHLGEDFSGIEAAAAWDDAKFGLKHLTRLGESSARLGCRMGPLGRPDFWPGNSRTRAHLSQQPARRGKTVDQ